MQVSQFRTPSGVNGAASVVAHAANPGLRASTPSNLDSTRTRIVKRSVKVSYQGVRAQVAAVRLGRCCVEYVDYLGRKTGSSEWLGCHLVQVVS